MKNRRKIMMWGCLLMVCLLTACHKGGGGRIGAASTAEASVEILKMGQESMLETITELQTVAVMKTLETIQEATPETRNVSDADKVEENSEIDQEEFTWLDWALAECLNKSPGELTEEDYLSVEQLRIRGGNIQGLIFSQNDVVKFKISGKKEISTAPFRNSQHDMIDMRDIIKCSNLKLLEIVLNYTPRPETYIIHYDDLVQLKRLESLDIWLNWSNPFSLDIADKIDDLSFVRDMPNLTRIYLENIDLPEDLSPLFAHHFWCIGLCGCNITEKD